MLRDTGTPRAIDEFLEIARSVVGIATVRKRAEARLDRTDETFAKHVRRKAVQRTLERIARVDALAADPRLALLPVHVVAEEQSIEVLHVRIVGEHDVPRVIEREPGVFDRAARAADLRLALDQHAARAVV